MEGNICRRRKQTNRGKSEFTVFPMTGKMKTFMSIRNERERESQTETQREPWGKIPPFVASDSPPLSLVYPLPLPRALVKPHPKQQQEQRRRQRQTCQRKERKPFFVLALCVRVCTKSACTVRSRERECVC